MKKSLQSTIASLSILVASCTNPDRIDIELSGNPWSVEGTVIAKGDTSVAGRKVEIIRLDMRGSQPVGRIFAATRTDQHGRFYFESTVDGEYSVTVKGDEWCIAHDELGHMTSQKRTVVLRLPAAPCALII
jgi:protocatechuate 3,4-dioxygenase beta subunit